MPVSSVASSLNTSVLASYALFGLARASEQLETSTLRLSTGSRLNRAGDDVASLSIVSRLRSEISSSRQAVLNAAQTDSLLQVAYGGLTNIQDVLIRQKDIATQANSGALTPDERNALQVEFDALTDEINRLATTTNFNSIKLLDGSATGENDVLTNSNNATQATGALSFAVNIGAGQTVRLNGVTFTEGVNFAAAGTIPGTLDNLVLALNNSTNTAISQATYQRVGNTIEIIHDAGGESGNQFLIDQAGSTAAFVTTGGATNVANVFTLQGGTDNGLNATSVRVSGTIGDNLVNTQSQTSASTRLSITGVINNGELLQIDNGNGGLLNFRFTNAVATTLDILIGATTEETIGNAVSVINSYTNTDDFGVRQLEAVRDGTDLVLSNKAPGNPLDIPFAPLNVAETLVNGTLSTATLNNGSNTGVNVSGVTNKDFVGTINGFSATFNAADSITASITVGSETYTANITDTTPAANTFIRFNSTGGGYFDVQLASAGGQAVADQDDADTYAARLNAAFSTLSFTQNRQTTSYTAAGQLANSSFEFRLSDFSEPVVLEDITVIASPGAGLNATIDFTVNGETFRSGNILGTIGDREIVILTSLSDANRTITFRNGSNTIDLSSQANADTFKNNLKNAFGIGTQRRALEFQIGPSSTDILSVAIGNAQTGKLYGGATPDVSSQPNAAAAETVLDGALAIINEIIADVGAAQERVDFATNNLNSSILAKDEARAVLEDTDIASEASTYALATVRSQAAIATLAQTNNLASSLLSLLDKD